MSRIVRALVPLALAATTAAVTAMPAAQAAPATPAATSQLQVVGIGVYGGMAHTIRNGNGSWDQFGWPDGRNYSDFYGVYAVTSVIVNGNENVLFDYEAGPLHTPSTGFLIRRADGTWASVAPPAGNTHAGDNLAVANVDGQLTVMRLQDSKFQLATFNGSGWSSWQDTGLSGDYRDFDIVANGTTIRLVAAKGDGTGFIEVDRTKGTWGTTTTVPFTSDTGWPQGVTRIDAAQVGDQLHVILTDEDRVYHSILHANGSWDSPADIAGETTWVESPKDVSAAEVNGELQVVITNDSFTNGDFMFHTIRHADGTWQRFGDVNDAAGPTNSGLVTIASQ